ncbi:hypothetical protein [Kordia sp.]|uniref:hypothetical protein n=1 Tax=Kordia sp. TaxID=1965332 RepID=UPI003D6B8099
MKKREIKSLQLNKKSISNFQFNSLTGGFTNTCIGVCPKTLDWDCQTITSCNTCNCTPSDPNNK